MTLPETGLNELFGIADENLRAIEETFGVRLAARGNEIQVVGEGAAQDAARLMPYPLHIKADQFREVVRINDVFCTLLPGLVVDAAVARRGLGPDPQP